MLLYTKVMTSGRFGGCACFEDMTAAFTSVQGREKRSAPCLRRTRLEWPLAVSNVFRNKLVIIANGDERRGKYISKLVKRHVSKISTPQTRGKILETVPCRPWHRIFGILQQHPSSSPTGQHLHVHNAVFVPVVHVPRVFRTWPSKATY